jgi:predicted nucleic acid-binding protein
MILIDISIWIDHLSVGHDQLNNLLDTQQVSTHPFIIGELACGNLNPRHKVLDLPTSLPKIMTADDEEHGFRYVAYAH